MHFVSRFGLLAALLALVQFANAAQVQVTQVSCNYLYFTLTLTSAEARAARYMGVYLGTVTNSDTEISEVGFNSVYANALTYQWYAPFFANIPTITSGTQQFSFRLLDENETPIAAYPAITQPVTFQCGTTVTQTTANPAATTTAAGGSTTDTNSGNNNGNTGTNGNSNSNSDASSTGSGSSSNTGAIAGGVVGGVGALVAVGIIAFCLNRKKKRQRAQQTRLRHNEADEAAFRAPNNDSSASLATAPETAHTPMMRDISTKNVFSDTATSGALSGTSTQFTAVNNNAGSASSKGSGDGSAAAAAAVAGGIGAAAIAARKNSHEQLRGRSFSHTSDHRPSSEFSKDNHSPAAQVPPPVPALPAKNPQPAQHTPSPPTSAPYASSPLSSTSPKKSPAGAPLAASAAAAAAISAAAASESNDKDSKTKTSRWGFKRASKEVPSPTSKPPYPSAVPEPIAVPEPSAEIPQVATSAPSPQKSAVEPPASPSRSFNVLHKPAASPVSMAAPSSASLSPNDNRTTAFPPRSGPATPSGSIRGNNYSRAPSVTSMSAGFTDAPPLPSAAASVASAPVGENMAGIGAGRSFAASSGNSTKWHQQSYNIMPNFSHRALARSTQLDEDLIFGHLGMGLNPPPGPAGNGSESGSSKSKTDPFA